MTAADVFLRFISHPFSGNSRLGETLVAELENGEWMEFRAAVAFARMSGVRHLSKPLNKFCARGEVRISVGLDLGGTSEEALREILASLDERGEAWVFHNSGAITFHPKVYLFKGNERAFFIVGSGNLTEGGLFTNYEASLAANVDLSDPIGKDLLGQVETALDAWSSGNENIAFKLDSNFLDTLVELGLVQSEEGLTKAIRTQQAAQRATEPNKSKKLNNPFGSAKVLSAPSPSTTFTTHPIITAQSVVANNLEVQTFPVDDPVSPEIGFLMTLQQTDVGVGQTTVGTSRRSPEIFIPLTARNHNPDFWGWPKEFKEDLNREDKFDRQNVKFRLGTAIIEANMMTWPVKSDFRIRTESLRSAGNIGDILRLEKSASQDDFDYYAEIIPKGRADYPAYDAKCAKSTPNSKKRWGYY